MALLTGMHVPISNLPWARYDNPLRVGIYFLSFPIPTLSHNRVSLKIESRGIPRKENPKIRNRRMQRKFNGCQTKPRLSVFCSTRQLYAMLVDDHNKKTLFYASTLQTSVRDDPPCTTIFNGCQTKPRLSVFCSTRQLYAMLVDDHNKKTLFYASTLQTSVRDDPPCTTIEAAERVGEAVVRACTDLQISEISCYDRNGLARGERIQAFEAPISRYGLLAR